MTNRSGAHSAALQAARDLLMAYGDDGARIERAMRHIDAVLVEATHYMEGKRSWQEYLAAASGDPWGTTTVNVEITEAERRPVTVEAQVREARPDDEDAEKEVGDED